MSILNKNDVNEVYSVSCVERYVLAYLRKLGVNISYLYCNSFLSVNHLISDFTSKEVTFANYSELSRIQDIAVEFKILELEGRKDSSLDFLHDNSFEYLLEMKPENFRNLYGKDAWREDHFFYIKQCEDGQYYYLNDNPLQDKIISADELMKLYNQRYVAFRYMENQIDKPSILSRFVEQYEREKLFNICTVEQINYEVLRDIISMLRISRKRVSDFISEWKEPNPEWIERVNSVFAKVEYSRVRKKFNPAIFFEEMDNFYQDEQEIGRYIQEINSNL